MKEFIIKYWLETIFAFITASLSLAIKKLYKKARAEREEQRVMKEGLLAILHDRLYQMCNFYIQQGWCSIDDLKNLEYVYNAYHSLGGNGTGTELYNRCRRLPLYPPIEKKGSIRINESDIRSHF